MRKNLLFLLLMVFSLQMVAQTLKITGKVIDSKDNSALPGVTIQNLTSKKGTITDMDGIYTMEAAKGEVLRFTFIGYETQNITIGESLDVNVNLNIETKGLEEIIVVGYGTQKKSLVTGAIAKVGGDDLAKAGGQNISAAMQGKTAGVQISSNSGQPGEFVSVTIRGVGTNGDNEPLYIVDGLPTNGHGIDYLSPSDIESIEVLKDAAAGAIYGARAGNGVVLITTKGGKKGGKFEVNYEGYYGVQNPWKKIQVLNSDQYMQIQNEGAANSGQAAIFSASAIEKYKTTNTDWQDQLFNKNAPKQSHTITMTGSGDKSSYLSSLSYFKQDGILAKGKSNFERYTWRVNANKEMGFLTLNTNTTYAHIKTQGVDANSSFGISLIQSLNLPPIIPADKVDGSYITPSTYGLGMQEISNTNASLSVLNNETNTNKFVGGISASLDLGKLHPILEGLKFKTSFNGELAYVNNRTFNPVYYFSAIRQNTISNTSQKIDKYTTGGISNVLSYDKTISEHHITVLLGQEFQTSWRETLSASKASVVFDDFEHAYIDNATDSKSIQASGTFTDEYAISSLFARINYDLSNRYMLTAVVRNDGSSNFAVGNKFGIFPSVSLGWVISREAFFPTNTPINMLKFRGSWGQNGNDRIGGFKYTSVIGFGNLYYFGKDGTEVGGTVANNIPNSKVKWETADQKDIAFDLGMFNDRLTITMDYYVKTTKDWLVEAPYQLIGGNFSPTINGGSIENKGLEIEISYKQKVQGIDFNLGLTGGFNKNKVTELGSATGSIQSGTGGFGQSSILRAEVGKPMGFFYGNQVAGVFQTKAEVDAYTKDGKLIQPNAEAGDFKFIDRNDDGKINDLDRTDLGDPSPVFTGGINLSVNYMGFDLYAGFFTALGQKAWTALRRYDQTTTNFSSTFYKNRWVGEGTSNTNPRASSQDRNGNFQTPSDYYVHDASYARLKNLTLGYTIPKHLLEKAKISKLRIYLSGENLLTFTKYAGYEPEMGGSVLSRGIDLGLYPQARSVIGGINISF